MDLGIDPSRFSSLASEQRERGKIETGGKKGSIFILRKFALTSLNRLDPRMDMDSPDKAVEGTNKEDRSSLVENPDIYSYENNDERRGESFKYTTEVSNDEVQADLDQDYLVSHVAAGNNGLQSPILKPNSANLSSPTKNDREPLLPTESDLCHDDTKSRISDYAIDEQRLSMEHSQNNATKEGNEDAENMAHPSNTLDNIVNETYNNEFNAEGSYPLAHNSLLTGNNNNYHEVARDEPFNHPIAKSPELNEADDGGVENAITKFHSEIPEVNAETDVGNLSPSTKMQDNNYTSAMEASKDEGMVWENSSLHSPRRIQNASPSPERRFSISAERSPHPPTSSKEEKPAHSPSSSRRKRSPSPEKHNDDRKRTFSRDRSSPVRPKSPSERTTKRDSHCIDVSPKRRTDLSPRRRDSPRRRGRSRSRSPVRRRDSPRRGRDHHHRSRSRSPYARDRYRRSPRRRPSPRRRTPPPSYSRHRSPKRPWSPPANRNTGLGKPGRNLFIAGFSYATTERDLEKKFSRFGRVTDVRIVRDKRSGESRGFGFLSLERDEDADAAIRAVDQTEWNGRILLVEKSKTSTR